MKQLRLGLAAFSGGALSFPTSPWTSSADRHRWVGQVLLAVLVLLVPLGEAAAQGAPRRDRGVDVSHRWGIGFADSEAPIGVRYLWNRRYGMDLGLGVHVYSGLPVNSLLVLDAAFLYALAPGDRLNLYFRPGVRFTNLGRDGGDATTIRLGGDLEFEIFLHDSFSIGARTGLFFSVLSPPGGGGDQVSLGTRSGLGTEAGFHYYLPASK